MCCRVVTVITAVAAAERVFRGFGPARGASTGRVMQTRRRWVSVHAGRHAGFSRCGGSLVGRLLHVGHALPGLIDRSAIMVSAPGFAFPPFNFTHRFSSSLLASLYCRAPKQKLEPYSSSDFVSLDNKLTIYV